LRHREDATGRRKTPLFSTGYGDAAIQEIGERPAFPWIASLTLATTTPIDPVASDLNMTRAAAHAARQ
jgi:hypothetical protein